MKDNLPTIELEVIEETMEVAEQETYHVSTTGSNVWVIIVVILLMLVLAGFVILIIKQKKEQEKRRRSYEKELEKIRNQELIRKRFESDIEKHSLKKENSGKTVHLWTNDSK